MCSLLLKVKRTQGLNALQCLMTYKHSGFHVELPITSYFQKMYSNDVLHCNIHIKVNTYYAKSR